MNSISQIKVKNKKVLLRLDLNAPLEKRGGKLAVADDTRIKASLPTIKYLINHQAKIIILSHLNRPQGKVIEDLRMTPVARRLGKLLGKRVITTKDCIGYKVKNTINNLEPGEVVLLENLRFHREEERNDSLFAKRLAELGDLYVNDAFSNSHREHASMCGITKFLPSYCGLLLEKELKTLEDLLERPKRPLVVILGGAKLITKIDVIKNFWKSADIILLGGLLSNVFLIASGKAKQIPGQKFEKELLKKAKNILTSGSQKIRLPLDVVAAKRNKNKISQTEVINLTSNIDAVFDRETSIFDIGPETVEFYTKIINTAKTIVWNGPLGLFEVDKFSKGTKAIAKAIAESKAESIVGGGETIAAIDKWKLTRKFSHVSTGGGAMDMFLAGRNLPGIEVLQDK